MLNAIWISSCVLIRFAAVPGATSRLAPVGREAPASCSTDRPGTSVTWRSRSSRRSPVTSQPALDEQAVQGEPAVRVVGRDRDLPAAQDHVRASSVRRLDRQRFAGAEIDRRAQPVRRVVADLDDGGRSAGRDRVRERGAAAGDGARGRGQPLGALVLAAAERRAEAVVVADGHGLVHAPRGDDQPAALDVDAGTRCPTAARAACPSRRGCGTRSPRRRPPSRRSSRRGCRRSTDPRSRGRPARGTPTTGSAPSPSPPSPLRRRGPRGARRRTAGRPGPAG